MNKKVKLDWLRQVQLVVHLWQCFIIGGCGGAAKWNFRAPQNTTPPPQLQKLNFLPVYESQVWQMWNQWNQKKYATQFALKKALVVF